MYLDLGDKVTDVQDLHDRRNKLWEENRTLLALAEREDRDFSQKEKEDWDKRDAEVIAIDNRIQRLEDEARRIDRLNTIMPPGNAPTERPVGAKGEDGVEHWIDTRSNHTIPVFGRESSMRAHYNIPPDFSVGRVLVAAATRNRSHLTEVDVRALGGNVDTGGGFLLSPAFNRALIDLARPLTVALQAGARVVPMDTREMTLAKLTGDPTVSWVPENAQLSETEATFGRITLESRTARFYIPVSYEIAADSGNLVQELQDLTARKMAEALDKAILYGSATGNAIEPTGIRYTSGVGTVTSVGTPTGYENFSTAAELCLTADAREPLSLIAHPRTYGTMDRLEDTTGQPLRAPRSWENLQKYSTTHIPIDEGAGSDESTAIIGPMSEVLVGIRLDARMIEGPIEVSKFQRQFVGVLRADVCIPRPGLFTVMSEITA